MSNPAQEEADRILNYRPGATSHPEDSHSHSHSHPKERDQDSSEDERQPAYRHRRRAIRSRHIREDSDADTDDESAMATMTTTKQSYTVPTTTYFANTGPKGVIADAQNFHRARRSTFRRTITSISDSLNFSRSKSRNRSPKRKAGTTNSNSGSEVELSDEDEQFLAQWRQQRLAELQDQVSSNGPVHTGRKTYGNLEQVNADGYLNAVEHTPKETNVVVLLNDPDNRQSLAVEDEIRQMAYKWTSVRFIKLHHEIAEMETVEIPAILAYRGGDVFATISGAEREGLEGVLREQGVLKK